MKKNLFLSMVVISMAACKKSIRQELPQQDQLTNSGNITANIQPVPDYTWRNMTALTNGGVASPTLIQTGDNVYCINNNAYTYKLNVTTKLWEPAPLQQMGHFSTGQQYFFCYNGRVYFGMNRADNTIDNRFMSQLPEVENSYVTLAPFPGTPVNDPTCFVIGNKGYFAGGMVNGTAVNQLWEYNFDTNVWVNKGNSPLGARVGASVVVAGNKAYMGLGYDVIYLNGIPVKRYKKDWILFDPASSFSIVKANFPGEARSFAKGFILNDVFYLGFGGLDNGTAGFTDFWKYVPSSNTWVQQQSWTGGTPASYKNMNCFALGNTGYAIRGSLVEFKRFSNAAF